MKPFSFESFHDALAAPALALAHLQAQVFDWQGDRGQDWQCLSGGFRNQNYALKLHGEDCVLRLSQDLGAFRREIALLRYFKNQNIDPAVLPLPQVFASTEFRLGSEPDADEHWGLALLSRCPGQSGLIALQQGGCDALQMGRLIGRSLLCLHQSLSFTGAGFINENLELTAPYYPQISHQGLAYREYMLDVLAQPHAEQVCGADRLQAMLVLLARQGQRFQQIRGQGLCHGDFNLKNMLLQALSDPVLPEPSTACQLTAVLDWEFACAGSPLGDIGNFYRFDHHLPADLFVGFAEGYGGLSQEQILSARLLDLASICNFLERATGPRSLELVNQIFDKTLALFTAN